MPGLQVYVSFRDGLQRLAAVAVSAARERMGSDMKVTIYSAYHKQAPLFSSNLVLPIQVGRSLTDAPLSCMAGDDTGDTISARNGTFCELTALYWVWKNDLESDMLGLMHYRRLPDLGGQHPSQSAEVFPDKLHIPDWLEEAENWAKSEATDWDVIVPRPHVMVPTVEQNYRKGHKVQDLDTARSVIVTDHPEYLASFDSVASDHRVLLGNIMLMTRPLFDRYCSWLFDILFKVEAMDLPRQNYSGYQSRYLGFLAERLLTVFVHHIRSVEPGLRVKEVGILNLSKTLVTPYLGRDTDVGNETVNIAFSADHAYLPHAAAMVRSLLDHADPKRPLNFYFLYSDLEEEELDLLRDVVESRAASVFHPLNTQGAFAQSYRSASRAPSNATYNRFLLFDLLPGLKRLLYLDADVILRSDVCRLYDSDIADAQIAAVTDWIMTRTLTGPIQTADPKVPDLSAYQRQVLGMSDEQISRYFNAGVLLFNFEAMNTPQDIGQDLLAEVHSGSYLFRDQDILNKYFKDKLFLLDPRWNVFNSSKAAYGRVPLWLAKQAMKAKEDPWLIHYADRNYKPWSSRGVLMAEYYWQALARTPFAGLSAERKQGRVSEQSRQKAMRLARKAVERFPILKRPALRIYNLIRR